MSVEPLLSCNSIILPTWFVLSIIGFIPSQKNLWTFFASPNHSWNSARICGKLHPLLWLKRVPFFFKVVPAFLPFLLVFALFYNCLDAVFDKTVWPSYQNLSRGRDWEFPNREPGAMFWFVSMMKKQTKYTTHPPSHWNLFLGLKLSQRWLFGLKQIHIKTCTDLCTPKIRNFRRRALWNKKTFWCTSRQARTLDNNHLVKFKLPQKGGLLVTVPGRASWPDCKAQRWSNQVEQVESGGRGQADQSKQDKCETKTGQNPSFL